MFIKHTHTHTHTHAHTCSQLPRILVEARSGRRVRKCCKVRKMYLVLKSELMRSNVWVPGVIRAARGTRRPPDRCAGLPRRPPQRPWRTFCHHPLPTETAPPVGCLPEEKGRRTGIASGGCTRHRLDRGQTGCPQRFWSTAQLLLSVDPRLLWQLEEVTCAR